MVKGGYVTQTRAQQLTVKKKPNVLNKLPGRIAGETPSSQPSTDNGNGTSEANVNNNQSQQQQQTSSGIGVSVKNGFNRKF